MSEPADPDLIDCSWCEQRHTDFWLCDPAREVLDTLRRQAMEGAARYDMPTIEMTNDVGENVEGILCKAISVRAIYTLTLGVHRPGIVIDPVMMDGSHIRPLIFLDEDQRIRRVGRLFDEMSSIAVRKAKRAREEAFRNRNLKEK